MVNKLEKIKRAKEYIDKLAMGIDPITDELAAETDVINQLPVSRCLYFVSTILREAAEELETPRNISKPEKRPFDLPPAQREEFEYSDLPISVSEIARRLNRLVDTQEMKDIKHSQISGWLVSVGLLTEMVSAQGNRMKRPSEQGVICGITVEHRFGANGPYTVVVYDVDAQKLILDNLDAILATEVPKRARKPKDELPVWQDEGKKPVSEEEIVTAMKRTEEGIRRELTRRNIDITVD